MQLQFQHDSYVQIAGIVLTGAGYFLFIWSVVARGKYAVSWEMSGNHKLAPRAHLMDVPLRKLRKVRKGQS